MRKVIISLSIFIFSIICLCNPLIYGQEMRYSLTINYDESTYFSLYKIGYIENGEYYLNKPYSDYNVKVNSGNLRESAYTLSRYIERDSLNPMLHQLNKDDTLILNDLSEGLYLLIGDSFNKDGYRYDIVPFLINLNTDRVAIIKDDITKLPVESEKEDITIEKRWVNDDISERPMEITVQVLRNGYVYREIVLRNSMNWKYVLEDLDSDYRWSVVEKEIPKGYEVEISQNNNVFTIINEFDDETTDSNEPENPINPIEPENPVDPIEPENPTNPIEPENPTEPNQPEEPVVPNEPETDIDKIPQTGFRLYGIFAMIGVGVLSVGLGKVLRNDKK